MKPNIRHYDDPEAWPEINDGEVNEYPAGEDPCDYLGGTASSTDCTGLITHGPAADNTWDPYEALYPFLPPLDDEL